MLPKVLPFVYFEAMTSRRPSVEGEKALTNFPCDVLHFSSVL